MAYNEVSKKATNTYRSKFDIIQIRVPQGSREQISKHASSCGESINAFINRAITETITRDTQKNQRIPGGLSDCRSSRDSSYFTIFSFSLWSFRNLPDISGLH